MPCLAGHKLAIVSDSGPAHWNGGKRDRERGQAGRAVEARGANKSTGACLDHDMVGFKNQRSCNKTGGQSPWPLVMQARLPSAQSSSSKITGKPKSCRADKATGSRGHTPLRFMWSCLSWRRRMVTAFSMANSTMGRLASPAMPGQRLLGVRTEQVHREG